MKPSSFNRINVVGTSGSGKSTLSRRLSQVLDAPLIEMDGIYWGSQWTHLTDSEFVAELQNRLQQPRWVLDGNYFDTIPTKWENVDAVVWLDYSFFTVFRQVVWRSFQRGILKEKLWGGDNHETIWKSFFTRDSIILWAINTFRSNRTKYEKFLTDEKYQHIQFIRLKNRKETEAFLEKITTKI